MAGNNLIGSILKIFNPFGWFKWFFESFFKVQFLGFLLFGFSLLWPSIKETFQIGSPEPLISALGSITLGIDLSLKTKMTEYLSGQGGIISLIGVIWIYIFIFRFIFAIIDKKNTSEKYETLIYTIIVLYTLQTFYASLSIGHFTSGFQGLVFFIHHLPALADPLHNSWIVKRESNGIGTLAGNATDLLNISNTTPTTTTLPLHPNSLLVQANATIIQSGSWVSGMFSKVTGFFH